MTKNIVSSSNIGEELDLPVQRANSGSGRTRKMSDFQLVPNEIKPKKINLSRDDYSSLTES